MLRVLFSSTSSFGHYVLEECCIVELLDEDSMIHCFVCCRQIDKSGSCDHTPLVVMLYVLNEFNSWLLHDFSGLKPACFLMRCP